jgi:hypothetical protein
LQRAEALVLVAGHQLQPGGWPQPGGGGHVILVERLLQRPLLLEPRVAAVGERDRLGERLGDDAARRGQHRAGQDRCG